MKNVKKLFKNQPATVAVSGGFDPIHIGHVRMFAEAKKLGDRLVVILNNDNWLLKKKGFVFMPEKERKEIIKNIRGVDAVMLTKHKKNPTDMSVANELAALKPNIFANGGDRKVGNLPTSEEAVCNKIGCDMVYNIGFGGKVQSSSWLTANFINAALKNTVCPCRSGKKFSVCGLKNTSEHKKKLKHLLNK